MTKWAELPEEILELVARRTASIEDFFRFGAVCRSWQLATVQKHYYPLLSSWHPWLMLSDQEECNNTHNFYSISSEKFYNVNLPEANACRCWGTPHGWLITIDLNLNLHLLNPISHVQIPLPQHPVSNLWNSTDIMQRFFTCNRKLVRDSCIDKALLSSSTNNNVLDQCIVTLNFQELAFVGKGDKDWTVIEIPSRKLKDLICFKGQLYAICSEGKFWFCDIASSDPQLQLFAYPLKNVGERDSFYLLELAEELHMVRRIFQIDDPDLQTWETKFFEVYKLDVNCKKWIEVNNLDDCALYIGRDTLFSVSASRHPELRRNCIYFTAESFERLTHGMRVFHLEHGTIEPFLTDLAKCLWFHKPIWFRPGLC